MTLSRLPTWALNRLAARLRLAMEDAAYGAHVASSPEQRSLENARAARFHRILSRLSAESQRRAS